MNLTSWVRPARLASASLLLLAGVSAPQLGCADGASSVQEPEADADAEDDDEAQAAAAPRDAGPRVSSPASPTAARDASTPPSPTVKRDAGSLPAPTTGPIDAGAAKPVDPLDELLGDFDIDALFGPDAGWGAAPGPAAADNPKECPPVAPDNPIGPCIGVPVYATCNYGSYSCLCDWVHWLCI